MNLGQIYFHPQSYQTFTKMITIEFRVSITYQSDVGINILKYPPFLDMICLFLQYSTIIFIQNVVWVIIYF